MRIATHKEGPWGRRGTRIVAVLKQCRKAPQKTTPYDHALNPEANHQAAAFALFHKLEPSARAATAELVSEYIHPRTGAVTRYWEVKEP